MEAFTRQGVEDVNVRRPRKEDVILLEGSGIEAALESSVVILPC